MPTKIAKYGPKTVICHASLSQSHAALAADMNSDNESRTTLLAAIAGGLDQTTLAGMRDLPPEAQLPETSRVAQDLS